jgi:hypothetical protein
MYCFLNKILDQIIQFSPARATTRGWNVTLLVIGAVSVRVTVFFFNFLFPILSGLYPYPSNIFFTFKIRPQRIFSIYVQQLQGGKFLLNEMVAEVPMETRTSVDNLKLSENVEVSIF